MTKTFKIGDRISWNSGAGRVSGTVIRVHTHNFDHKSYIHHASPAVPQYRRGYCLERAVTARPRLRPRRPEKRSRVRTGSKILFLSISVSRNVARDLDEPSNKDVFCLLGYQ
jgi:hypothetical protein